MRLSRIPWPRNAIDDDGNEYFDAERQTWEESLEDVSEILVSILHNYLGDETEVVALLPGKPGVELFVEAKRVPSLYWRDAFTEDLQRATASRIVVQIRSWE